MIRTLVHRHLICFFRDRFAVFFSILGALILLGLYVLFLGKMQIDALSVQLPTESRPAVESFILNWVFSGIIISSSITVPLSALGILVEDRMQGRIKDFLVSPVSRTQLTISYLVASVIITMVILLLEVAVGSAGLAISGHRLPSLGGYLRLGVVLVLLTAVFSAIGAFMITLVSTQGGMSALSSLVGTLAGFLAGAYIPPIALPTMVVSVMNLFPFAPAAMLLRQSLVAPSLAEIGFPEDALREISVGYGLSAVSFGLEVTPALAVGIVAGWGLVLGGIALLRMRSVVR
ncbi:ABC transporter permease [Corynebacterium pacaense]|uniref:ABC transporter permease n=1 Tax=Corynebacterium pacaense TaxID=1816684 RepID=UPI0009BB6277|nr:ABC transporter permease [Corynebacterium pacaense]